MREIRRDDNIFVKADKTTNHYKTEPVDYFTLVNKNVTKAYKKTNHHVPNNITSADKKIAQDLSLDDRIETSAKRDVFITLKDHKPDFMNNPSCRLINPSKSEIGIISKKILDNINKKVITATKVNLWKSTSQAIEWFQALPNKTQLAFITFDVCDFYPSISEHLLAKALDYAAQFPPLHHKTATSSCTRKNHSSTTTMHHGRRKNQKTNSMSPWAHMTEQRPANL